MIESYESMLNSIAARNPHQPEFLQAVDEVMEDVIPYMQAHHQDWLQAKIVERITEPERIISFRVIWLDDNHQVQVNRGYRVQMNSAIGPYKGGLRFSATVNLSILKFIAFEQVFKNSLTGLPLGGGKGGSDFNPKGKSDNEIMRFCQSFMTELYRHIGSETDVPAGDIGVGGREIGFLFGQYKRLRNHFTGVLTGKNTAWGGSYIRPEATGYGLLYFVEEMLSHQKKDIRNLVICISGAGNVAQYAAEKSFQMGAKVVTLSNSSGTLYDPNGFDLEKLAHIATLGRDLEKYISAYPEASFHANEKPWKFACDIALPCATQNELDAEDAERLIQSGCMLVAEGANMPCTTKAVHLFKENEILFGPAKAANAGGVAVSGLEMSQNSIGQSWSREQVDGQLKQIMQDIHQTCITYGTSKTSIPDYLKGANIGGFIKVAGAMMDQGAV